MLIARFLASQCCRQRAAERGSLDTTRSWHSRSANAKGRIQMAERDFLHGHAQRLMSTTILFRILPQPTTSINSGPFLGGRSTKWSIRTSLEWPLTCCLSLQCQQRLKGRLAAQERWYRLCELVLIDTLLGWRRVCGHGAGRVLSCPPGSDPGDRR